MPARPPAPRDRTKTRERILDEAFTLFATVGFQGTTLSEVERRVGLKVGTGSLYHHFRSKEDLLRAAVEREVQRCTEAVNAERAAVVWPDDPHKQMALAATLALANVRRFDALFRLLQTEGGRVPELRATITSSLFGAGALGAWVDDPVRLVTIAAITGYHFFEQLKDAGFEVATEDEFIAALISVIPPGRPPGVDEATFSAMKASRVRQRRGRS
jgi:AcrR family transcriptional regulator